MKVSKTGLYTQIGRNSLVCGRVPMALLRQEQVAELLQLSASTLEDWRWKREGPPFIRISRGCIRYEESDIMKWLETRRVYELRRA